MTMEFWAALLQITFIDMVLSGDNAVVIAMAARGLPPHQQRTAVIWGSGGAVVLRVLLTMIVVTLLNIPFLKGVGGLLLVWIAFKLLMEDDEPHGTDHHSHGNLASAVKTILVADAVMSLDNMLAVAAVSKGNYVLLAFGLALLLARSLVRKPEEDSPFSKP